MGGGSVMLVRLMLMPSCAWIDMAMSSDCNNEALMQAPDGGHYVKQAHFLNTGVYGAPSLGGQCCAFSP